MQKRAHGRSCNELRSLFFGMNFAKNAQGSCFVKMGDTHVLCTATVEERLPSFLRGKGSGWITAEYGMLPCSAQDRIDREAVKGKQSGRTQEIQRLIGRCLRAVVNLKDLGERQIKIDCDVLQADGGTRTASITGAFLAMHSVIQKLMKDGKIKTDPILDQVAAISCGILDGTPCLDLDYKEDSSAEVDFNFVFTSSGKIIEMQGCAEGKPFDKKQFDQLYTLAFEGTQDLFLKQKQSIEDNVT